MHLLFSQASFLQLKHIFILQLFWITFKCFFSITALVMVQSGSPEVPLPSVRLIYSHSSVAKTPLLLVSFPQRTVVSVSVFSSFPSPYQLTQFCLRLAAKGPRLLVKGYLLWLVQLKRVLHHFECSDSTASIYVRRLSSFSNFTAVKGNGNNQLYTEIFYR